MAKLKVAVICSSNMNRSMEAHSVFAKRDFQVSSYGTGDKVKIPGKHPREPNIYPFGTSYEEIYKDLVQKDRQLYTENGMLHILDRNMRIKDKPEKFQESDKLYDVILTCEERVYDLVIEKFEDSGSVHSRLAHVVNIDVIDNLEDATIGAFLLLDLASKLEASNDLDDEIDEIVHDFEGKCDRSVLHSVVFY